jgi:hypothetical protein
MLDQSAVNLSWYSFEDPSLTILRMHGGPIAGLTLLDRRIYCPVQETYGDYTSLSYYAL